jgi:hypothetical protein
MKTGGATTMTIAGTETGTGTDVVMIAR